MPTNRMRNLTGALLLLLMSPIQQATGAANDQCSGATLLCANIGIASTNVGATAGSGETLSCGDLTVNNSVWFVVNGIAAGTVTVTVSAIDNAAGLDMEIFSGSCGALTPLGVCASGSPATGRSMSVTFPTTANTSYYVMVDGSNANAESFNIIANSTSTNIVGRPNSNFNTSPTFGCAPLTVNLVNTTVLQGGTNISYGWQLDNGGFVPASGADTIVVLNSPGNHTIALRVCNSECGCKIVSQDVLVQELVTGITATPLSQCAGSRVDFAGNATVIPNPPYTDPNITNWSWNFGDPASGTADTASGDSVNHIFSLSPSSFDVTLIASGACGTDTARQRVTFFPVPTVTTTNRISICEGAAATLDAVASGGSAPLSFTWSGPATITCASCSSTTVSGLTPTADYTYSVTVTDSRGCSAVDSSVVHVDPLPVVTASPFYQVCRMDSLSLSSSITSGSPPFIYNWTPASALNSTSIPNPSLMVTGPANYCVTVTDATGCTSLPACSNITVHPAPTLSPGNPVVCASDPNPQNTLTVSGAGAGSTYSWMLSANPSLIIGANVDSSSVTVGLPGNVAGSYSFTVIVTDGVTGCRDTVSTGFSTIVPLNVSISGPNSLCSGDSVRLVASGANSYAWTSDPGTSFADSTNPIQVVGPSATTVYSVTGTTGSCSQTATYTVYVAGKPDISIVPIPDFCGCDTLHLQGSSSFNSVVYSWSGNAPLQNTFGSSVIAFACSTSNFTLTVTDTTTGCRDSISTTAISHQAPVAAVQVTPDRICTGTPTAISLDGTGSDTTSGTTYLWAASDPTVVIPGFDQLVTTTAVTDFTLFTLTVTDRYGCDTSVSDTVNVFPAPSISASAPYLCTTDTLLQSTILVSGASASSNYSWIGVPLCVAPVSATSNGITFDFGSCGVGQYDFRVFVFDSLTGCSTQLVQTVNVIDSLSLVTNTDTTVCEGASFILTAYGANSFLWSTGATTDTAHIDGLLANGSTYVFSVTGTAGLCSDTRTVSVNVIPLPVAGPILGPDTVCEQQTGIKYYTNSGGYHHWTMTGGTIVSGQGTDTITVNWSTAAGGTITLVDTNLLGCAGNTSVLNVTVASRPTIATNINGPFRICAGSIIPYFVLPNAGSTYTWTVTGGTVLTDLIGDSIRVSWSDTGTGSITVYETTAAGCDGPITVLPITVHEAPTTPSLLGDLQFCQGTRADYAAVGNPDESYHWQVNAGIITAAAQDSAGVNVEWNLPGMQTISVYGTNTWGCSSLVVIDTVTVLSGPDITVTPDSVVLCSGDSISLSGVSSYGQLNWTTSGGGSFSSTSIPSPVYYPAADDAAGVVLTVIAVGIGCPNDTDAVFVQVSATPTVLITATDSIICEGNSITLTATGGFTYSWPGGDSVMTVTPANDSIYVVTVTNAFGCSGSDSISIRVLPIGIANAGSDIVSCSGDAVNLNGSQQFSNGASWSSNGDGTFIPSANTLDATYLPGPNDSMLGSTLLLLTAMGPCGNVQDSLRITYAPAVTIDAGNDTTIVTVDVTGVTIPLNAVITPVSGVIWTTSGTGSFVPGNTAATTSYIPSDEDLQLDSIIITATTVGGCTEAMDAIVIEFIPFVIPNVITPYPASPGQNDFFLIRNLPSNTQLKLWDRWGLPVFESPDYHNNWDAANLKSDLYYYVLTAQGREFHGWLKVIREE